MYGGGAAAVQVHLQKLVLFGGLRTQLRSLNININSLGWIFHPSRTPSQLLICDVGALKGLFKGRLQGGLCRGHALLSFVDMFSRATHSRMCPQAYDLPVRLSSQPRAWRNFVKHLPPEERHDVLGSYHARLRSSDAAVRDPAVLALPSSRLLLRPTSWVQVVDHCNAGPTSPGIPPYQMTELAEHPFADVVN